MANIEASIKVELTKDEVTKALLAYIKATYDIDATDVTYQLTARSDPMDRYTTYEFKSATVQGKLQPAISRR